MKKEKPQFERRSKGYIPPAKRLFPIEDAAVYLGISPKTIRNRVGPKAKDPFPVKHKKIGKRVLFDKRDLDAFVDSLETR